VDDFCEEKGVLGVSVCCGAGDDEAGTGAAGTGDEAGHENWGVKVLEDVVRIGVLGIVRSGESDVYCLKDVYEQPAHTPTLTPSETAGATSSADAPGEEATRYKHSLENRLRAARNTNTKTHKQTHAQTRRHT